MFRGALDAGATTITEGMKLAAADAIASVVSDDELEPDFIIPSVFDKTVAPGGCAAVADAACRDERLPLPDLVADRLVRRRHLRLLAHTLRAGCRSAAPAGWQ